MAITRKPYAGGPIPNGWEKIPGMSKFIRPIAVAPEDVQSPAEAKDDETMHIVKVVSLPGPTGKDGIDGKDGKDGKDGVDGKDGRDGIDGINGIDGKHGKDGKAGPKGLDGKDGKDGRDGEDARGIKKIVSHGSDMEIELTDGSKSRHKLATGGGSSFGGSSPSLGTMAQQNANAVAVTGGTISGTSITVKDNVFTLQDDIDPTKQAQFQLSGIGTGTTNTYTLPSLTTSLAGLGGTETFTGSKTFSSTTLVFGSSAGTSSQSLGSGATTTGNTKTVNVGTSGLSGSTTAITVGSANGSTTTMLGSTVIGGVSGNQSLQVNNVASAVNYAQIVGATTTNYPAISAQGTDTNVGLLFDAKGSGNQYFRAQSGAIQFQVGSTASAVNYIVAYGNTTTNYPTLSASGTDANVGFVFNAKGTASVSFQTSSIQQASISYTASAVNYLQLTGAATGAAPTISAAGSDTNIGLVLSSKGTGVVALGGSTVANSGLQVGTTASAVNFMQVLGAPTGGNVNFQAKGTDTNIGMDFVTRGTGIFRFYTQNFTVTQLRITDTPSAVNFFDITGAVTTGAPEIIARGSDTNISLKLTPKGTGTVQFGTYTAGIVAQAGYITITDAGGTSRRLLVG